MSPIRNAALGCTLLLAMPLLHGCVPDRCVKGKGTPIEHVLQVAPFQGIQVKGSMDVEFRTGVETRVVVVAQANIAELVEAKVKDGVWNIDTRECYATSEPFVIRITAPFLDRISVHGSGDVVSLDPITVQELVLDVQGSGNIKLPVEARRVNVSVQGSGDVRIEGSCGVLTASVQGSGDVDAVRLESSNVSASVMGSGDIAVHAIEQLDGSIAGSGNITYRGSPAKLVQKVTGSGRIERLP